MKKTLTPKLKIVGLALGLSLLTSGCYSSAYGGVAYAGANNYVDDYYYCDRYGRGYYPSGFEVYFDDWGNTYYFNGAGNYYYYDDGGNCYYYDARHELYHYYLATGHYYHTHYTPNYFFGLHFGNYPFFPSVYFVNYYTHYYKAGRHFYYYPGGFWGYRGHHQKRHYSNRRYSKGSKFDYRRDAHWDRDGKYYGERRGDNHHGFRDGDRRRDGGRDGRAGRIRNEFSAGKSQGTPLPRVTRGRQDRTPEMQRPGNRTRVQSEGRSRPEMSRSERGRVQGNLTPPANVQQERENGKPEARPNRRPERDAARPERRERPAPSVHNDSTPPPKAAPERARPERADRPSPPERGDRADGAERPSRDNDRPNRRKGRGGGGG